MYSWVLGGALKENCTTPATLLLQMAALAQERSCQIPVHVHPSLHLKCTQDHIDATANDAYIKSFCWTNGTYDLHSKERLSYYQWVPVVLALQVSLRGPPATDGCRSL